MITDNLKDFTVHWALFGLLFFCLITFSINFLMDNSPNSLSSEEMGKFTTYNATMSSTLSEVEGDSNDLLNITSFTNPELSDLGSRDSVATSYGLMSSGKGFFDKFKLFTSWVLGGEIVQVISVMAGLFSIISIYLIIKFIRNGV